MKGKHCADDDILDRNNVTDLMIEKMTLGVVHNHNLCNPHSDLDSLD